MQWICCSAGAPGPHGRELFEALLATVAGIARACKTTG